MAEALTSFVASTRELFGLYGHDEDGASEDVSRILAQTTARSINLHVLLGLSRKYV